MVSRCLTCTKTKDVLRWYHQNTICGTCNTKSGQAERTKKWRQRHPDRVLDGKLRRMYGISLRTYQDLLSSQQGTCWICKTRPDQNRLVVDHCHSSKKIRGLLCRKCNNGLGLFNDNIDSLASAIAYLTKV